MITLERANSSRRIGPWSLLGLILVPLLVAGGFLWATWDSDTRLDRVEAAVVNLDEPVTSMINWCRWAVSSPVDWWTARRTRTSPGC